MALSMEYGDFKLHKANTFELDHVIAHKKSLKFDLQNVLMRVNLENSLPQKLPTIQYWLFEFEMSRLVIEKWLRSFKQLNIYYTKKQKYVFI